MSDSDGELDVDKEQLRRIEQNDIKTDKKAKRNKRMENRGKKVDESGSEISESEDEEAAEEEGEGILKSDGKKKEKTAEHAPVKKTNEAIKKSQFLGEKYGHYKCGVYIRIEVRLDKAISRKLEPEYPVVLCSLKH
jgi:hypothetical protein